LLVTFLYGVPVHEEKREQGRFEKTADDVHVEVAPGELEINDTEEQRINGATNWTRGSCESR